jgi:hypothetical protein
VDGGTKWKMESEFEELLKEVKERVAGKSRKESQERVAALE